MDEINKEWLTLKEYKQKIIDRALNDKVLYMALQQWRKGEMSWEMAMTMAALVLSEQQEKTLQLAVEALSSRPAPHIVYREKVEE